MTAPEYRQLRRLHRCSRCRRRRPRPGLTKCSACADLQRTSDHVGHLRRAYALTPAEHRRLVRAQRGRCFVCRHRMARPHVDHNHQQGHVRAALCRRCNTVEGLLMGLRVAVLLSFGLRLLALRAARW